MNNNSGSNSDKTIEYTIESYNNNHEECLYGNEMPTKKNCSIVQNKNIIEEDPEYINHSDNEDFKKYARKENSFNSASFDSNKNCKVNFDISNNIN